jgi:hypothetical protein
MQAYANKKRRDLKFEVGEWVFLKLRPHRQQSVMRRINQKLAARFYGPFQIIDKVGEVAYKLQLPEQSKIHPVFHVSLLKKAVGQYQEESELPDNLTGEQDELYEPEAILAARKVQQQGKTVTQLLVHWKGKTAEEATWEDLILFKSQFPSFNLEDKVVVEGGGIDRIGPHEQLVNNTVRGPKEWMVYSRRGRKVTSG